MQLLSCTGHQHLGYIDRLTRCKGDPSDSSILPFALAGSLGWCYCGNSCLVEGGRYFVDVVQRKEGEYQTGTDRKAKNYNE